jgi:CRISPR system Cascade subunit CasE
MFLSRCLLDPRSRQVRRDLADAQELHRTLLSAFGQAPDGTDARAHFGVLHRTEINSRRAEIAVLVLSRETPDWTKLPAGVLAAAPATKRVDEAYAQIRAGASFRFRLVANPTRAAFVRGERGPRRAITSDEERLAWLGRQLGRAGARVVSAGTRPLPPVILRHGGKAVSLPSVRFDGLVEVADPAAFQAALVDGIGAGKAYGMGLLTIAPA